MRIFNPILINGLILYQQVDIECKTVTDGIQ